jgi:hypothetical protein
MTFSNRHDFERVAVVPSERQRLIRALADLERRINEHTGAAKLLGARAEKLRRELRSLPTNPPPQAA